MGTIRREGERNMNDLYAYYVKHGGILSYEKYKQVMKSFTDKVVEKIITTGYMFNMPYFCGILKVIQLERKVSVKENGMLRASIDWGSSNKLKKEITERGDTPLVKYKNDSGEITGDNGGVPWLCYFTTSTYFSWAWSANVNMRNCLKYTFDITRNNTKLLSSRINENSEIIFNLRQRNGTNKDYLNRLLATASSKQVQN